MLDTHSSDRHRYAALCGDFTVDADPLEVQDPWLGAVNHAGRGLRRFTLFCCILAQHQYVRVFWNFVSIHILLHFFLLDSKRLYTLWYRLLHIKLDMDVFWSVALDAIFEQKCKAWYGVDCTQCHNYLLIWPNCLY